MNLLDQVEALPRFEGPKTRRRWSEFVAPYRKLIAKGYPKAEAARTLAELAGLDAEEAGRLYRASKQWKKS